MSAAVLAGIAVPWARPSWISNRWAVVKDASGEVVSPLRVKAKGMASVVPNPALG